jgi:hypothetical protein
MYKRRRSNSNSDASQALSLSQLTNVPSRTTVTVPANMVNSNKSVTIRAKNKKINKEKFTLPKLYDILFPKFRVKRYSYGRLNYGYSDNTWQYDVNARTIQCAVSKQGFGTYVHLPVLPFGETITGLGVRSYMNSTAYGAGLQTGFCLNDLVKKSIDIRGPTSPQWNPFDDTLINAGDGYTLDAGITGAVNTTDMAFQYHGGYTKHRFTNSGNATAHVTIHVSRPRRPMWVQPCFDTTFQAAPNATQLNYLANFELQMPALLALADKVQTGPTYDGSSLTIQNLPSANDNVNDLAFRYSKHDSQRLFNFETETKHFTLGPGEKLEYTIVHDKFSFSEAVWNNIFSNATLRIATVLTPINRHANLMPFCSAIMDVMVQGEVGHKPDYGALGSSACVLTHEQEEYHNARYCPTSRNVNTLTLQDLRDNITAGTPMEIINDATDTEVIVAS